MSQLREQTRGLLRRMLQHLQNNTTDLAPEPMREEASVFTDPVRWQTERRQFFIDTPQVVALGGELRKPGSIKTLTLSGVPVVLTRDADGELRAFINACTHRGACLQAGQGGRRLRCPFHGWNYHLDGRLAGRPEEAAFDPPDASLNLQPLAVAERAGVVMAALSPAIGQAQVDQFLGDLEPALGPLDLARMTQVAQRRYTVAANWKLVAGLSHESYHFAVLHGKSLAPLMSHHAVVDFFGDHSRWAFPLKGIDALQEQPESEWPEAFPGAMNHTIFPGTVLISNPADVQIIRVEPGRSVGESIIEFTGYSGNPEAAASSVEGFDFGAEVFEQEDLWAAEQCQAGLQAGLDHVLIGRNEPVVQFWHRLWRERLRAH